MNLLQNVILALRGIRSNLLRTILTFLIMAFGIMALVGILTATDGIKSSIRSNFSSLGATVFNLTNREVLVGGNKKRKRHPVIKVKQAEQFKERYQFPSSVGISTLVKFEALLQHQSKKTNPNVRVFGVDEQYLNVSGYEIAEGRNFGAEEVQSGLNAAIIGVDVAARLFEDYEKVLGELIAIDGIRYKVIGVLKSKGVSQMTTNNQALIPYVNAERNFVTDKTSYSIAVEITDPEKLDLAMDEAIGLLSTIRKIPLGEDPNFELTRSDKVSTQLIDNLKYVIIATVLIGIITLLGAGIRLMNIMLVSVNERTREIGITKALGAKRKHILQQYLIETVVICLIGGVLGIVLGIAVGNGVSIMVKAGFIMPWLWIGGGIFFCTLIGLLAGLVPAIKASRLNPVEALRYE